MKKRIIKIFWKTWIVLFVASFYYGLYEMASSTTTFGMNFFGILMVVGTAFFVFVTID